MHNRLNMNGQEEKETWPIEPHPQSIPQDLIGKQIGEYKITRLIGRGGMAVVYEAYQVSLDRYVALKIIPQSLIEEPEYLERFKREATSAARLSHPNIVSIHGFGQFGNTYYYIMDLAKGKTLENIIEEKKHELLKSARRFDIDYALNIIEQVANALSYAHKEGVIHRDIKPANIMVDEDSGRVLITDFGLAKSTRWDRITPRASLFGTPAYMSPEQASGKELDRRTDIYSLGAVLYEMLTGTTPYVGNNALEVIDKVKTEPITPPRKINPDIPQDVESIILKAMSKDLRLRYQNMDEFLLDIQRFRKGPKITTYTKMAEKRIERKKVLKHRAFLLPIYVLLAIILLLFGFSTWYNYIKRQKEAREISSKFQLAENYERLGMKGEAIKVYKEIIEKHPNSEYATRARERLP